MSAVESIGTSSEVKEQYGNMKKFAGGGFFIFSSRKKENGRK